MLYSLFHCAFSNEGCDYNPTKKSPNYVNGQYENDKTVKKWAYHINQQPFLNLCYNQLNTETYFLFKLNNDITIHITTKQGTSIMFSGAYYTHRQALHINQQPFINLSAYGNNMLFNHIRRSVDSEKWAYHITQQPFLNLCAHGNNMLFDHICRNVWQFQHNEHKTRL